MTASSTSLASTSGAHRSNAPKTSSSITIHSNRPVFASTTAFRAKSEGAPSLSQTVTSPTHNTNGGGSSSPASAELFRQIQVTKERHREHCEKAMNFGGSSAAAVAAAWKPSLTTAKLPRPGNDYARYATTAERDKVNRRLDRERSVMEKILSDRTPRAVSLENNRTYKTTV